MRFSLYSESAAPSASESRIDNIAPNGFERVSKANRDIIIVLGFKLSEVQKDFLFRCALLLKGELIMYLRYASKEMKAPCGSYSDKTALHALLFPIILTIPSITSPLTQPV